MWVPPLKIKKIPSLPHLSLSPPSFTHLTTTLLSLSQPHLLTSAVLLPQQIHLHLFHSPPENSLHFSPKSHQISHPHRFSRFGARLLSIFSSIWQLSLMVPILYFQSNSRTKAKEDFAAATTAVEVVSLPFTLAFSILFYFFLSQV